MAHTPEVPRTRKKNILYCRYAPLKRKSIPLPRTYYAPPWQRSSHLHRKSHHCCAAAVAAAESAVCLVSTKSWTEVIFTLSPEDLSVKMKIDSLTNDAPPGASPCSFD